MTIEAMKQALEALEEACGDRCNAEYNPCYARTAITALRQAIEQAEKQEPVAKVVLTETLGLPCLQWLDLDRQFDFKGGEYLYTTPQPQREWVGLMEEEIAELHHEIKVRLMGTFKIEDIYRAIEAKLKEKNT